MVHRRGSPLLFSPLETKAQSPLWPEPVATEVVEGNSGWTDIQWLPKLSSSPSVSRSVYYASVDGSAIAGMDYRPVEGVLVFPAGHNSPGLPSPQSSKRSRHTKSTACRCLWDRDAGRSDSADGFDRFH